MNISGHIYLDQNPMVSISLKKKNYFSGDQVMKFEDIVVTKGAWFGLVQFCTVFISNLMKM